jgi:uncharacterized protein (TIGR03437 family)
MRLLAFFIATLGLNAQSLPSIVDASRALDFVENGISFLQVDSRGDVYVAGTTKAGLHLPGVKKLGPGPKDYPQPLTHPWDIYVVKLDPTLQRVIFATSIGGSEEEGLTAMRVDAAGNVFLVGGTASSDFPLLNSPRPVGAFTNLILKLNAAGDALSYVFDTGRFLSGRTFDVDTAGAAYLAGETSYSALPASPGVYLPSPIVVPDFASPYPFVLKLAPSGEKVEFATYLSREEGEDVMALSVLPNGRIVFLSNSRIAALNSTGSRLEFSTPAGSNAQAMTVDSSGNFYVLGNAGSSFDSYTLQKFSVDGQPMRSSQYGGGSGAHGVIAAGGKLYIAGRVDRPSFPTRNAIQVCQGNLLPPTGSAGIQAGIEQNWALLTLNADGTLFHSTMLSVPFERTATSPSGTYLYALGTRSIYTSERVNFQNSLARLDLARVATTNRLAPSCLAHGATYTQGAVSPGEIMTIYGSNLGPNAGVAFALQNQRVPTELAGTSVTVDGTPAPILYVQDTQVNFVAPWSARTSGVARVCISRNSDTACMDATAQPTAPGIFTSNERAIVIHRDGTLNSPTNPISPGDFVSLYLTGAGTWEGPLDDGSVAGLSLQKTTVPVTASIEFSCIGRLCIPPPAIPVQVSYAGSAPTLVSGVTQLNLRIPETAPNGGQRFVLKFGTQRASAAIYVGP